MKRNMDLIRQILLQVEASPHANFPVRISIEGQDDETISYHVRLLDEAGLIEARDPGGNKWVPLRLTWRGQEFLEAARDNNVWEKAKQIASKSGGIAFETLFPLLLDLGRKALGL